jgi:hypothetical protein
MGDVCELVADDSCNILTMLTLFKDDEGDHEYWEHIKQDPWFRFVDINGPCSPPRLPSGGPSHPCLALALTLLSPAGDGQLDAEEINAAMDEYQRTGTMYRGSRPDHVLSDHHPSPGAVSRQPAIAGILNPIADFSEGAEDGDTDTSVNINMRDLRQHDAATKQRRAPGHFAASPSPEWHGLPQATTQPQPHSRPLAASRAREGSVQPPSHPERCLQVWVLRPLL